MIHKLYQNEPSFKLTVGMLEELKNCYGGETTIDRMLAHVQGNKKYKCPKCCGTGSVRIRYNAYPSGLPDSGWVEDWKYLA